MLGGIKNFHHLIILLQGGFAGVLLGQIVHLFIPSEAFSLPLIIVQLTIITVGLLLIFFRHKIQQLVLKAGSINWIHYASLIIYGIVISLYLLSVFINFEESVLIAGSLQLATLFFLMLVVAENKVLHLNLLQKVYADLLNFKRTGPIVKNTLWFLALILFAAASLYLYQSNNANLHQVLLLSLSGCSVLFALLALVKIKILKLLRGFPLRLQKSHERSEGIQEAHQNAQNNYYSIERDLPKALLNSKAEERSLLYATIRQIPLIDKIEQLETIKEKHFADDEELNGTINFLRRLREEVEGGNLLLDLDTEGEILNVKAYLRLGIVEGNPLPVQKLLNDNRPEVKKAAILATVYYNEPSFIPALVNFLKDQEFAFAAGEALFEYGDQCLPFLRAARYRNKDNTFFAEQCLELVERFSSQHAGDFLIEMLNDSQKILQYRAAAALLRNGIPLSNLHKTQILAFTETLIGMVASLREIRVSLDENKEQLYRALLEEEQEKTALVYQLLKAFIPPSIADYLTEILAAETDRYSPTVFALIDLYFPLSLRAKCKILMGNGRNENIAPAMQPEFPNEQIYFAYAGEEEAIGHILKLEYGQIGYWLRACALKQLSATPGQQVSLLILAEVFNKNPLLQEVACEALYHLNYDYYFLQMQRLPAARAKELKHKIEHYKPVNNNGIEEDQLLFNKIVSLRSFSALNGFSFEQFARQTAVFRLLSFGDSKKNLSLDPYQHKGYWLVAEGSFTIAQWGEECLRAGKGDMVDMSFLEEAEAGSLILYPESELKIYFIEYFAFNRLYLKSGYSKVKVIRLSLELETKFHLA